jgi:hypothetical protein
MERSLIRSYFFNIDSREISPLSPASIGPFIFPMSPSLEVALGVQNGPQVALEG